MNESNFHEICLKCLCIIQIQIFYLFEFKQLSAAMVFTEKQHSDNKIFGFVSLSLFFKWYRQINKKQLIYYHILCITSVYAYWSIRQIPFLMMDACISE